MHSAIVLSIRYVEISRTVPLRSQLLLTAIQQTIEPTNKVVRWGIVAVTNTDYILEVGVAQHV